MGGAPQRVVRPTLDVQVAYGGHDWTMRALVDTGASACMFPRGAGEALGIDFDLWQQRRHAYFRIAGARRPAIPANVILTLSPFDEANWDAEVWFFVFDWELSFAVLGNDGFFDKWAVTFNRYAGYFVVEPILDFERRMPVEELEQIRGSESYWDSPPGY